MKKDFFPKPKIKRGKNQIICEIDSLTALTPKRFHIRVLGTPVAGLFIEVRP